MLSFTPSLGRRLCAVAADCHVVARKESITVLLTAVLMPAPKGGFTALNPETGTTTQGETVEAALANLREATEVYLEEFPLETTGHPLVTTFQVGAHF